jgi:hypothetical protein
MNTTSFAGVQTAYAELWGKDMNGTCPDTQAAACPDVPVELRLSFFPDASPFINATMVQKASEDGKTAGDVASGLVFVDVNAKTAAKAEDGTEKFAYTPDERQRGPSISMYIPFNRPVNVSDAAKNVRCLRSVKGRLLPLDQFNASRQGSYDWALERSFLNSTEWAPYGAGICYTFMPGAYVLAHYPAVPAVAAPTAAQLNTTSSLVSWEYTFQADFDTLTTNATALATFRDWVELSVANATGLPGAAINLTAVRKGSVVAEVDVWVPRSYTPTQLAAIKTSMANATTVFDLAGAPGLTFKGPVAAWDPTVPRPVKQGPSSTTVGIAVGVAVGGTVLLAAVVAGVVVMRRRRQAVQP